jgi:hypothetical protein
MKSDSKRPVITQQAEDTTPPELLAEHVRACAEAGKKLLASGLTREALVVLLDNLLPYDLRITKKQIGAVLDAVPHLDKYVTKRRPKDSEKKNG